MSFRRLKPLAEHDKAILMEELKNLLQAREEILLAILYGSLADPQRAGKYGDVDLALYVKPDLDGLQEFVLDSRIELEIYKVLSDRGLKAPPIEILIINHAPTHFLVDIFKSDYQILKGDEAVFTDLIDRIGAKSMANFYFRQASLREMVES